MLGLPRKTQSKYDALERTIKMKKIKETNETKKLLTRSRESVRELSSSALQDVAGGDESGSGSKRPQ